MTTRQQLPAAFGEASRLGFGCASLGSRVGAREGLAAAAFAFARGVNWFDLAPSYGDGEAELIFAQFAKGRRDKIFICSKVGLAPPKIPMLVKTLKPIARAAIRMAPALRGVVARARDTARSEPISGALILSSVEASLRRLGTDYIDVVALHDPSIDDLRRPDVADALMRVVSSGKARVTGIAGSLAAAHAALDLGLPVAHLQFAGSAATSAQTQELARGTQGRSRLIVTHSVFDSRVFPAIASLAAKPRGEIARELASSGYGGGLQEAVGALLLDARLQSNPEGIVLASMFSRRHALANLERLSASGRMNALAVLDCVEALAQDGAGGRRHLSS